MEQKRSWWKKVGIILLVVLVPLGVFLFMLDVLNLFPVERVISNIPFNQKQISVTSEVSGVEFGLQDEEKLQKYLNDFGFFEEGNVYFVGVGKVSVKNVDFKLVAEPLTLYPISNGNGEVFVSIGQRYYPETQTMEILYQTAPSYYQSYEDEYMSKAVSSGIIGFLRTITTEQVINGDPQAVQKNFDVGKEAVKDGPIFFFSRNQ